MSQIFEKPHKTLNHFNPDPKLSYTMPASHYFDPEILEQEKEKIFYRSWQPVAHVSELSEPKSYVTTKVVDQQVVVIRKQDGKLSAFFNVCQHRGHVLLEGRGKLRNIITCPYHAWGYDHSGCLVAAPDCDKVVNFDKADFKIPPVQVEEFFGFVFVNLDPAAKPIDECYPGMRAELEKHFSQPEKMAPYGEIPFDLAGNWKNVGDNALECYHCSKAHRDFVNLVDMSTYEVHCHDNWSLQFGTCRPENNVYNFGHAMAHGDKFVVVYMFPGMSFSRFAGSDGMLSLQFTPSGPETTRQLVSFYGYGDRMTEIENQMMEYFGNTLGPEDVSLIENVQLGLHSLGYQQGRFIVDKSLLATGEHAVHHFHSLVLKALAS
jgi:phenylpropionate dioxygenase-like ring-hydroxylating dioxygenase large terminal subunit